MDFQGAVDRYNTFCREQGSPIETLRAEAHVESFKDWSLHGDLSGLVTWFQERQAGCQMQISDIPLCECRDWLLDEQTGYLRHRSGEFFYVQGVRVEMTAEREVGSGGWDQPILTQVGFDGGLLGLLRYRFQGIPHYLVEAKAEPGNPDKVQISPTLQATFSNLRQAHGGRRPRFAEYFEEPERHACRVLFDQWMSEDGGRLHLKRNRGMLVELEGELNLEPGASFRWVSLFQLKELIKINSWVNPHVRGIISHL